MIGGFCDTPLLCFAQSLDIKFLLYSKSERSFTISQRDLANFNSKSWHVLFKLDSIFSDLNNKLSTSLIFFSCKSPFSCNVSKRVKTDARSSTYFYINQLDILSIFPFPPPSPLQFPAFFRIYSGSDKKFHNIHKPSRFRTFAIYPEAIDFSIFQNSKSF